MAAPALASIPATDGGGATATEALREIQLAELRLLYAFDKFCCEHQLVYWIDGGTLLGAVRHGGFIPWDDDIDIVMPRADMQRLAVLARSGLPAGMQLDVAESERDADYNVPCRVRDTHSSIIETQSAVHRGRGLFVDIFPADNFHAGGPKRALEVALKFIYRNLLKIHQPQPRIGPLNPIRWVHVMLRLCRPVLTPEAPAKAWRELMRRRVIRSRFQQAGTGDIGYGFDVRWTRIFRRTDIFPLQRLRFETIEVSAPANPDGVLRVFYGPDYMIPLPPSKRPASHFGRVIFDIGPDEDSEGADGGGISRP